MAVAVPVSGASPQVLVAYRALPRYRGDFFDSLKKALEGRHTNLMLVFGDDEEARAQRNDDTHLEWAQFRPNRFMHLGNRHLIWQPVREQCLRADLVIVEQASRLLLNYWLLEQQRRRRVRVAFWGHGGNLNVESASRLSEALKRRVSRYPHWWFAYSEGTKRRLLALGYPEERITVANNAIATEKLRTERRTLRDNDVAAYRSELKLPEGPTALFLGSLYGDRRVDFLLEAADGIYRAMPTFSLLIGGDGPERTRVRTAAGKREYTRYLGRLDGGDKGLALAASQLLLIPASVGLSILDGFAVGMPLVTTDAANHGPEIEYLEPGVNGLMLPATTQPSEYAGEVVQLLCNPSRLESLSRGAQRTGEAYTNERMVNEFAAGVDMALAAKFR